MRVRPDWYTQVNMKIHVADKQPIIMIRILLLEMEISTGNVWQGLYNMAAGIHNGGITGTISQ